MPCEAEIHQYDIGTIFRVTIQDTDCDGVSTPLDVSGATTKQLIFKKPCGDTLTKTASFTNDGTDGVVQYATIENDLDEVGEWKLQAYVILAGGRWRSDVVNFLVYGNL